MSDEIKYKVALRLVAAIDIETDKPEELPLPHGQHWSFTVGNLLEAEVSAESLRSGGDFFVQGPNPDEVCAMYVEGARFAFDMAYKLDDGFFTVDKLHEFLEAAGEDGGVNISGEIPPEVLAAVEGGGLKSVGQLLPASRVN